MLKFDPERKYMEKTNQTFNNSRNTTFINFSIT